MPQAPRIGVAPRKPCSRNTVASSAKHAGHARELGSLAPQQASIRLCLHIGASLSRGSSLGRPPCGSSPSWQPLRQGVSWGLASSVYQRNQVAQGSAGQGSALSSLPALSAQRGEQLRGRQNDGVSPARRAGHEGELQAEDGVSLPHTRRACWLCSLGLSSVAHDRTDPAAPNVVQSRRRSCRPLTPLTAAAKPPKPRHSPILLLPLPS